MFLNQVTKALFSGNIPDRARSSGPSNHAARSEWPEPSPEIRAAVRRRRLGLPGPSQDESGRPWASPVSYTAVPVHKRASTRPGLASSDTLIVTRFLLSEADASMTRLLGRAVAGCSVLDFDLGGLELAWHSDLSRALEYRAAIWSVSRLVEPGGDLVLEHVVMPCRSAAGQTAFVGWYHRVGGSLAGDPVWSEIIGIGREQRAQRISEGLPETMLPDLAIPDNGLQGQGDIVSAYRAKGAM